MPRPGDPANAIAGQSGQADPEFMRQLREQFGLDKPLPVQLWIYLQKVVTFNLGISHRLQTAGHGRDWRKAARKRFC